MVARLGDVSGGTSPGTIIHLTLAMVLSPLLFVKVLIARYYKSYYSLLMPIGLVIFVLAFVLIGITAGPSLVHQARMQTVSLEAIDLPPASIDLNMAAATMEKRCSKCHNLDRIAGARKDAPGWLSTVNRMKALPGSGISEADSRIIVSYLASELAPKGSVAAASLEVGRALVDQRCGRCHSLDRVYKTAETPEEWRATVTEMVGFADGGANAFHPGEDEQIIAYLSATQTPDAVDQRKAQVTAASSTGRSMVSQKVAAASAQPAQRSRLDSRMIGFFSLVCLSALTLIIRRPARAPVASADQAHRGNSTSAGPDCPSCGFIPKWAADPSAGEHHNADPGLQNPAVYSPPRPEAQRTSWPVSHVFFSLRWRKNHQVIFDLLVTCPIGLRRDNAKTSEPGLRLSVLERAGVHRDDGRSQWRLWSFLL